MTTRSRLPISQDMPRELTQFLDNLDRKQQAAGRVTQLTATASLADVIAKLNELIASQA